MRAGEFRGRLNAPAALLSESGDGQVTTDLIVNQLTVTGNGVLTQTTGDDGASDGTGIANTLLGKDPWVYVNDPSGYLSADEHTRIRDAIAGLDAPLTPYSVTVTEVGDSTLADVVLAASTTSPVGGAAAGVLGCFEEATNTITVVEGWDWYAGADPAGIGAGQYDFQTTVTHELGHALGLGHVTDPNPPMHGTLAAGVIHRELTVPDLIVPDPPAGADALMAAEPSAVSAVASAADGTPSGGPAAGQETQPAGPVAVPALGSSRIDVAASLALSPVRVAAAADPASLRLGAQATGSSGDALRDARVAPLPSRAGGRYLPGGGDEPVDAIDDAVGAWLQTETAAVRRTAPVARPADAPWGRGAEGDVLPPTRPDAAALDAYFAGTGATETLAPVAPIALLPGAERPEPEQLWDEPSAGPEPGAALAALLVGVLGPVGPGAQERKRHRDAGPDRR